MCHVVLLIALLLGGGLFFNMNNEEAKMDALIKEQFLIAGNVRCGSIAVAHVNTVFDEQNVLNTDVEYTEVIPLKGDKAVRCRLTHIKSMTFEGDVDENAARLALKNIYLTQAVSIGYIDEYGEYVSHNPVNLDVSELPLQNLKLVLEKERT